MTNAVELHEMPNDNTALKALNAELLEALEYLTTHSPERHEGPSIIPNQTYVAWKEKARAAIAKAKGAS